MLLYGLGLAAGVRRVQHLKRSGQPCDQRWSTKLEPLKSKLALRGHVTLLESALVRVPSVIGWLKPVILLPPATLSGLTVPQLEAVLLHELAHIKRRDYLVNLLQSLVETLFFYHPAARWLSKQVRTERENCCDDLVVHVTDDPLTYARALTRLETDRSQTPIQMAASGGHLMNRVRRLTHPPQRQPTPRLFLLGALVLGLLAACASTVDRSGRSSTAVNDYQKVCLEATVAVGKYVLPAFNTASVKAMSVALSGTPWEVSSSCDDTTVRLDYAMTFDTGTLSWSAELRAVDATGRTVSSSSATDAFDKQGAFQYTTESTAERLLAALTTR